mgnify:CR=1 FL=1
MTGENAALQAFGHDLSHSSPFGLAKRIQFGSSVVKFRRVAGWDTRNLGNLRDGSKADARHVNFFCVGCQEFVSMRNSDFELALPAPGNSW